MWLQRIFRGKKLNIETPQNEDKGNFIRLTSNALRQLDHLQLNAGRYLPGQSAGLRPSLRRKLAAEFREHRAYVPGDDIRYVDWKASARQEHIFVRQGEFPKQATVYLFLDLSASMDWGTPPKKERQLQLAAALGYLALAHGDRLVVVPLCEKEYPVFGPLNGKGQFTNLLSYLSQLSFSGRFGLKEAVRPFWRKYAAVGGLVFILSDFLAFEDIDEILGLFPAPTWDVNLFHLLHPEELNPDLKGNFELFDVENGQRVNYDIDADALFQYHEHITRWQNELELMCLEYNAFYGLIPTSWSVEKEILSYLRKVNVVGPL